jgi:LPS-assembly protein
VSFLAALAAATLVRAAAPAPLPGVAGDVQVTADHVTYEVGTGRVLLEGNAVIRRGAIVLRARSASWDPVSAEVRASGGVLLTDATRVISAEAIRAVLGGEVEAEGVLAFVKDRPADLSALRSGAEAGRAGRNRVTFSGERLRGSVDGRVTLSRARLTLCDCPRGGPPSWEVTAREADVVAGKRAILRWSVIRIAPPFVDRTVPVLVVPWLYVPLGERQSGLLMPVVASTGATGFGIAEPLYLTLGRSADATLTPEYAFGRPRARVAEGKPAVRGPGARLELRFAPAEEAEGRVEGAWVDDLDAEPGGESGHRWAVDARHRQRLGDRTALHAGLRLAGDAVWVRDMTPDVLARNAPYRRSDLLVSHARDAVVAEAFASYDQPFQPEQISTAAAAFSVLPGTPYGPLGADAGVASRWGSAAATLLPVAAGPLRVSARVGAARFSDARAGPDVAGRPGVTRADARAEVAAPVLLGDVVTVAPFVRAAALGYGFDAERDPAASAWGVGGAVVETEISRRYGRLRHAILPRLEWRAGTRAAGEVLPFPAYDAHDRSGAALLSATPDRSFQQLRVTVETRLRGEGTTVARAELGQDADLRAGRFAETTAAVGIAAGPVAADARASFFALDVRPAAARAARIPSDLDRFTELRASIAVQDRRGDGVRAGFLAIGPGGSGTLVAGIDPLFDLRPAPRDVAATATVGVSATAGAARIAYDALLPGRAAYVQSCSGRPGEERRVGAVQVQQHAASLAWQSTCRCFRLVATVRVNDCAKDIADASYSVALDLAGLAGALAP